MSIDVVSPLRQRMIEDMTAVTYLRQGHETRRVNQSRPLGFSLLAAVLVQQGEHAAALAMVRGWAKTAGRNRARSMERGASSL